MAFPALSAEAGLQLKPCRQRSLSLSGLGWGQEPALEKRLHEVTSCPVFSLTAALALSSEPRHHFPVLKLEGSFLQVCQVQHRPLQLGASKPKKIWELSPRGRPASDVLSWLGTMEHKPDTSSLLPCCWKILQLARESTDKL